MNCGKEKMEGKEKKEVEEMFRLVHHLLQDIDSKLQEIEKSEKQTLIIMNYLNQLCFKQYCFCQSLNCGNEKYGEKEKEEIAEMSLLVCNLFQDIDSKLQEIEKGGKQVRIIIERLKQYSVKFCFCQS